MIPGMNLLNMAFGLIAAEGDAIYYRYKGEITADDGTRISDYEEPTQLPCCSIQPIDRSRYQQMGLSFEKTYYQIFVSQAVAGVDRGYAGDVIEWQGRRYQLVSDNPWLSIDGWDEGVMVDIGPASGATVQPCMG